MPRRDALPRATPAPRTDYSQAEIERYYRDTTFQYRTFWTGKRSHALHYGYWDETTRDHTAALHRLNAVLADRVAITDTDRVLDLGCGWGGSSIWLLQKRGCEVVGLNLDGAQVAKCWENAETEGVLDRINFQRGDYHRTSFRDGLFDVVWALESVCHSPQKPLVFEEMARLLKDGGRLVMAEYFRSSRPMEEAQEAALHAWLDQWVIQDVATCDEYDEWAREAGFESVEIQDVTANIRPSSDLMRTRGRFMAPVAHVLNWWNPSFYNEMIHANWRSTRLQHDALAAGAWRYGILSARKG